MRRGPSVASFSAHERFRASSSRDIIALFGAPVLLHGALVREKETKKARREETRLNEEMPRGGI